VHRLCDDVPQKHGVRVGAIGDRARGAARSEGDHDLVVRLGQRLDQGRSSAGAQEAENARQPRADVVEARDHQAGGGMGGKVGRDDGGYRLNDRRGLRVITHRFIELAVVVIRYPAVQVIEMFADGGLGIAQYEPRRAARPRIGGCLRGLGGEVGPPADEK